MVSAQPGSLHGVRVLDLTRVLAGPFCTQILADHGADVWKIEKPGDGDETRAFGPPFVGGESTYFLSINRNKRSVAVDAKDPRGRALLHRLAAEADVVVENFRPGAASRLGLGPELREKYPRLVYCSISGYGQDGPWRERAGYDLAVQGLSGLQSLTGDPDGMPTKVGTSIADLVSGMYAAQGILLALVRRERTGQGDTVDVGMLDAVLSLLTYQGSALLNAGKAPSRLGNRHPSICPYETFPAADGHFNLAVANDSQWRKLCAAIARPALQDDPRFATNPARVSHRDALFAELCATFGTRSAADWLATLRAHDVPCGEILSVGEALSLDVAAARQMVVPIDHPAAGAIRVPGVPVKLAEAPGQVREPPPTLGQHTDAVLREVLGLTETELEPLRREGVIA
jgi:crotonobetainyl-CoA:carnitine CoA-transferase CaiB-like acyl-CoA transferase